MRQNVDACLARFLLGLTSEGRQALGTCVASMRRVLDIFPEKPRA